LSDKRFTHGFSLHSSYSFSKTISNSDSVANLADVPEPACAGALTLPQNVPHRYTLSFISELPKACACCTISVQLRCSHLNRASHSTSLPGQTLIRDGNPLSDRPGNLGRTR